MRRSRQAAVVAQELIADEPRRRWGYELYKATNVSTGVLYPMLDRFVSQGWLADGWEQVDPTAAGRTPRRFFTVTTSGYRAFSDLVADAHARDWSVGSSAVGV